MGPAKRGATCSMKSRMELLDAAARMDLMRRGFIGAFLSCQTLLFLGELPVHFELPYHIGRAYWSDQSNWLGFRDNSANRTGHFEEEGIHYRFD
jgi:hypothetical protein